MAEERVEFAAVEKYSYSYSSEMGIEWAFEGS